MQEARPVVTGDLALPDLMALSGRRGTEFIAVALIPLFAVSLRRGVGAWLRDDLRPLLGITAMLALSLLVGEFLTDGVVKVFVTLSGVAWAVVVLDEPHALGLIARWGTWLCLVGLALSLASRGALSPRACRNRRLWTRLRAAAPRARPAGWRRG